MVLLSGVTSDLGSALTRLCLRQRGLEEKLKAFVGSLLSAHLISIPLIYSLGTTA